MLLNAPELNRRLVRHCVQSGKARGLLLSLIWKASAIETLTPSSLESNNISFVLGVGTTVADSAEEGMAEAANVEVEGAAFTLVDDGDEVVGWEAAWADVDDDVDDVASQQPRRLVCTMMWWQVSMGLENSSRNASSSSF